MTATKKTNPDAALGRYKSLAHALWDLQVRLPAIDKDGTNPHYRSRYATYDHIKAIVDPVLHEAGLLLEQSVQDVGEDEIAVSARVRHVSTGEASAPCTIRARATGNPQEIGKTITYYRRYTLVTLLGIRTGEDDDGEAGRKAAEQMSATRARRGEDPVQRMLRAFEGLGITREQIEAFAGPVETLSREDIDTLGEMFRAINENGAKWEEIALRAAPEHQEPSEASK